MLRSRFVLYLFSASTSRTWQSFRVCFQAQAGAITHVPDDAMAFVGRQAALWCSIEVRWEDASRDKEFIGWGRETMAAIKPFAPGGHYVNEVVESGVEVVPAFTATP